MTHNEVSVVTTGRQTREASRSLRPHVILELLEFHLRHVKHRGRSDLLWYWSCLSSTSDTWSIAVAPTSCDTGAAWVPPLGKWSIAVTPTSCYIWAPWVPPQDMWSIAVTPTSCYIGAPWVPPQTREASWPPRPPVMLEVLEFHLRTRSASLSLRPPVMLELLESHLRSIPTITLTGIKSSSGIIIAYTPHIGQPLSQPKEFFGPHIGQPLRRLSQR